MSWLALLIMCRTSSSTMNIFENAHAAFVAGATATIAADRHASPGVADLGGVDAEGPQLVTRSSPGSLHSGKVSAPAAAP
jgi:hypothetical protein